MKIILSPAKTIREEDTLPFESYPQFLPEAEALHGYLLSLGKEELKKLWRVQGSLFMKSYDSLQKMDLKRNLSPALLAYDGIQYRYLAPESFTEAMFAFARQHLRILSGFYGLLRPFDGIAPYRLEMMASIQFSGHHSLYSFWGDKLQKELCREDGLVINLASEEYSKAVSRHLGPKDRMVDIIFYEKEGEKLSTKGVYAKIARGEMTRFLLEEEITEIEDIKAFSVEGYQFQKGLSGEDHLVFVKERKKAARRISAR